MSNRQQFKLLLRKVKWVTIIEVMVEGKIPPGRQMASDRQKWRRGADELDK